MTSDGVAAPSNRAHSSLETTGGEEGEGNADVEASARDVEAPDDDARRGAVVDWLAGDEGGH